MQKLKHILISVSLIILVLGPGLTRSDAQSTGLIAAYGFNDTLAPLKDSSGNNLTAQCVAGATCPSYSATSGYQGSGAYNFAGAGNSLTLPDEARFDFTNNLTVSFWMKVDRFVNPWEAFVNKRDTSWSVAR